MNPKIYLSIFVAAGLTGCAALNQPLSEGGYDPLGGPSRVTTAEKSEDDLGVLDYAPGTEVETAFPDSVLYYVYPKKNTDQPDVVMPAGLPFEVVSRKDLYVQVKGIDGVQFSGFVPNIMLAPRGMKIMGGTMDDPELEFIDRDSPATATQ